MATPTPQPVKAVLALRRIPSKHLAAVVGKSEHHTSRVVNGWVPASPAFRAAAAGYLGLPEEELFRIGDWFQAHEAV